ncbi:MAG TPA: uroporphyrinogen decarboxylase family protein [Dehalococcoidia bacterium]|nr:uroporphyrinogen decarboxylase family protein [Dehalococcoidia bacterium]
MEKSPQEMMEERRKRVLDAVALKKTDRVPIFIQFGAAASKFGGITTKEGFSNPDKLIDIYEKLLTEFQPDFYIGMYTFDMRTHEILGTKSFSWPGHGVADDAPYQFVEGEYLKADEWDQLLNDTGDFIWRTYLPRIHGNLEALKYMPPAQSMLSYFGVLGAFMNPAVTSVFKTIVAAAESSAASFMNNMTFSMRMAAKGFPTMIGFGGQPPFDLISDFLRGLKGSTLDMFRYPDKLLAAEEKFLPYCIESTITGSRMMGAPLPAFFLHRGSDEFMSVKQFEKFYWPGLKKLLLATIDAGFMPFVFWEGTWDNRLEYLKELPKGKVLGWFDRTDLFKAKKVLGDHMCLMGDVPVSLLTSGTPQQIKDYTKRLIDEVGRDGGFIMAPQMQLDSGDLDRIRIWADFTREYGVYK